MAFEIARILHFHLPHILCLKNHMRDNKFWKGAGRVSGKMIGTLALFSGLLSGLIVLIRPWVRKYKKLDLEVIKAVGKHTNEQNTKLMSFVTFFGTHKFLIPANLSLIGYFLFIRRHSWFSIRIASIALSSLGLMFLLKALFRRKRPVDPVAIARGLSFPSGHALIGVTFYGLLIYIISKTVEDKNIKWPLITALLIWIQLIGFSRVYLRVHYASDVAVGYVIGLMWLTTSLAVLKQIEKKYQVNAFSQTSAPEPVPYLLSHS
jgi:membrane-associated phospholipid phosphatase